MIPQTPCAKSIFPLLLQSAVGIILCGGCRTELTKSKDVVETVSTIPVTNKNRLQLWGQTEIARCKFFSLFFKHDSYQSNLKLHRPEECMLIAQPRYFKSSDVTQVATLAKNRFLKQPGGMATFRL